LPGSANAVSRLEAKLSDLAGAPVELERPSNPEHGDYASNAALQLAPTRKRPPRELAEEIARAAEELHEVDRAEVAGPGFVNLWIAPAWYGEALAELVEAGRDYGSGFLEAKQRVQVECVSANPTGPITVAAARNGVIGDCVARMLEFGGDEVEREYYYNDSGTQMELFRASVGARRRGKEPPEDGYHGEYLDELAGLEGDPVPHMLQQIEQTLERFRIHFDTWALQSVLEQRLPELLERVDTYEKDGALWANSSKYGDDEDRVAVRSLERGGLPTYRGADIVYLDDKLSRGFDLAVYVLGTDHHGAAKWYPAVARMLGYDPARVEVILYQLVHLTRGGEQTQISKRRGDVVLLDDFMDEIGVDAARWYLASRGPDQTIDIDVDLAAEKTQKNPVYYVQYAHARIAGILRNATREASNSLLLTNSPEPEERELIKRLAEFPKLVAEATERRGPQAFPNYAIRVADDFHRFYHEHRVLGSDAEEFRLALCKATQAVIARSLDLIGVEAPERM
jgi:arginyl-tRNA synthetase